MRNYTTFFDRNPLRCEFIAPTGSGQVGEYTQNYIAWADSDGIHYSGEGLGTDNTIAGLVSLSNIENLSFALDDSLRSWFGIGLENSISIFSYLNGAYSEYSLTGRYPFVFYDKVINPSGTDISCFYLKNDDKIYLRKSSDNFASETLVHHTSNDIQTLKMVYPMPENYENRLGIWGQYVDKNGFLLISDRYNIFESGLFCNFIGEVSGEAPTGIRLGTEPTNKRFLTFLYDSHYSFDGFQTYSGELYSFTGNDDSFLTGVTFTGEY